MPAASQPFDVSLTGNIAQIVSAVATLIAVGMALRAAMQAYKTSIESKRLVEKIMLGLSRTGDRVCSASLLVHFQDRYDRLVYEESGFANAAANKTSAANEYYHRFWNLQVEQFHAFIDDLIAEMHFRFWLSERHADFQNNRPIGGVTFKDGWEKIKSTVDQVPEEFKSIIERVRNGEIEKALERCKELREEKRGERAKSLLQPAKGNSV